MKQINQNDNESSNESLLKIQAEVKHLGNQIQTLMEKSSKEREQLIKPHIIRNLIVEKILPWVTILVIATLLLNYFFFKPLVRETSQGITKVFENELKDFTRLLKTGIKGEWGITAITWGYPERGLALIDEAIAENPGTARLYHNKAWALFETKKYTEALSNIEEAIKLDPDKPQNYFLKGDILISMCDYKNAALSFKKCIELAPNNLYARYRLAVACANSNEIEKAFGELKTVVKFDSIYILHIRSDTDKYFSKLKEKIDFKELIKIPD